MATKRRLSSTFDGVSPGKFPENMIYQALADPPLNNFFAPVGVPGAYSATNSLADGTEIAVPVGGTCSKMYVALDTPAGATTNTFTVYKNGVATALTCSVPTGQTTSADNTHSFAVVQGDLLSIKLTGAHDATNNSVAFQFAPS